MQIAAQSLVTIDYVLTDEDGTLLDRSGEGEPFSYVHGTQSIVPGLENALEGKSTGDRLELTLPPEDGYGPRFDSLVHRVPRESFEPQAEIQVGMLVTAKGPEGELAMRVVQVEAEEITLDANHPLAGVTLKFEVDVVEVRGATEEELREATQDAVMAGEAE